MTQIEYDDAVEQVEEMKVLAEVAISKNEDLKWLQEQPQFQRIINEGYFKEYPREIADAIATNTGGYDEEALLEDLKAIKHLAPYFFKIVSAGDAAEQSLIDNQRTLSEMLDALEGGE